MIEFRCPYCLQTIRVPDERQGSLGLCSHCKRQVRVPGRVAAWFSFLLPKWAIPVSTDGVAASEQTVDSDGRQSVAQEVDNGDRAIQLAEMMLQRLTRIEEQLNPSLGQMAARIFVALSLAMLGAVIGGFVGYRYPFWLPHPGLALGGATTEEVRYFLAYQHAGLGGLIGLFLGALTR